MNKLVPGEPLSKSLQTLGVEQARVVGHGALAPLGIATESTRPVEVEVTPDDFARLEGSGGKAHKETGRLYREGLAISPRQNLTEPGVTFQELPEVYETAQSLGDSNTAGIIRRHILDAEFRLPESVIAGELENLQSVVPTEIAEQPELKIAAELLYGVRTLYGSLHAPDGVRLYRGSHEKNYVPATYHNYEHSAGDVVRGAINHIEQTGGLENWSTEDYLAAIIAGAGHDIVMGNGRKSDNPETYDEKSAAELVRGKIIRATGARSLAEKAFLGVMATEYNETSRGQNVRPDAGAHNVQVAVAGADLSRATTEGFLQNCFLWPMEEQTRRNSGRPLAAALSDVRSYVGASITPESFAEAIDEDNTARQAMARAVIGNAGFARAIRYPEGWSGDNPDMRERHAVKAGEIGERISAGASVAEEYAAVAGLVPEVWS